MLLATELPLGIDFVQVLLHLFNVVILFAGLYILLYAPVKAFMDKRQEYFRSLKEDAEKAKQEAEEQKAAYDQKLKDAEVEIAAGKKAAEKELDEIRKQTRDAAKAEARELLEDTRRQAERERRAIISGAREDISRMIEEAARKVMQGEDAGDPYEEFLKDAERNHNNG